MIAYPSRHAWERIHERLGPLGLFAWQALIDGSWPATDKALALFNVNRYPGFTYQCALYGETPVLIIVGRDGVVVTVTVLEK